MNRKNLFVLTVLLILTLILCLSVACAPTQNQGNSSGDNEQNGGQISSGDNQDEDSEDKPQNPIAPTPEDPDDNDSDNNNSDSDNDKKPIPGDTNYVYPKTMVELELHEDKILLKRLLVNYIDENSKEMIAIKGYREANLENTTTIAYDIHPENKQINAFYKTEIEKKNVYFISHGVTNEEIHIDKIIKYQAKKERTKSNEEEKILTVNVLATKAGSNIGISKAENEFQPYAKDVYKELTNETYEEATYFAENMGSGPAFESGNWPFVRTTVMFREGNTFKIKYFRVVTKDYGSIATENKKEYKVIDNSETEFTFGSENTIFAEDLYTEKVEIDGLKYGIYDGEATVMGYTSDLGKDVIIPDSITYNDKTYSVTKINSYAFYKNSKITSLKIGNSVTEIGSNAFEMCLSLKSIVIPESVSKIGSGAFAYCSSLEKAYYKGNLSQWCKVSIEYEQAHPLFHAKEFYIDGKLLSGDITIPDGVTSIGDYAFYMFDKLTQVVIPSKVNYVGDHAFEKCSILDIYCEAKEKPSKWSNSWNYSGCPVVWNYGGKYGVLENGLKWCLTNDGEVSIVGYIGDSTTAIIPKTISGYSVTSIGNKAFFESEITKIELPSCITKIQNQAFAYSKLTSIEIPYGITYIDKAVFSGCSNITKIVVPNSVTIIGEEAFQGCKSLTSINIPSSVTTIEDGAFYRCSGLRTIVIPSSVTTMGRKVFYEGSGTIYCEVSSKPSGWDDNWNFTNRSVVWGYKG